MKMRMNHAKNRKHKWSHLPSEQDLITVSTYSRNKLAIKNFLVINNQVICHMSLLHPTKKDEVACMGHLALLPKGGCPCLKQTFLLLPISSAQPLSYKNLPFCTISGSISLLLRWDAARFMNHLIKPIISLNTLLTFVF